MVQIGDTKITQKLCGTLEDMELIDGLVFNQKTAGTGDANTNKMSYQ